MSIGESLAPGVMLCAGDCVDVLKCIEAESIDASVTDPPYGLGREPDAVEMLKAWIAGGHYDVRSKSGFMGKEWDAFVPQPAVWKELFRVLKPGAHVLCFFGTRTYDLGVLAMRLAGFEVRDLAAWLYGTGFPKSRNALKPAIEPIVLARRPLSEDTVAANVRRWRTGALNIDGCRVATTDQVHCMGDGFRTGKYGGQIGHGDTTMTGEAWKMSAEGRWPANVVHDGSNEVVGAFPIIGSSFRKGDRAPSGQRAVYGTFQTRTDGLEQKGGGYMDSGSAARFFFSAKASKGDRANSKHPTVKPVSLMQWLTRLITPPGGTVIDLFAGTGTTGEAAWREGFKAVLIERETEYQDDIRRRMKLSMLSDDERARSATKALVDWGPLFAAV